MVDNNNYLNLNKEELCSCFSNVNQTLDIYNIKKYQMKKICYALELAQKERPNDRTISKLLREYSSYLKNYK